MMTRITAADKVVMFMHNQDIDMLYSLSMTQGGETNEPVQQFGQFGINSIRMKSTIGIAGAVSNLLKYYFKFFQVQKANCTNCFYFQAF